MRTLKKILFTVLILAVVVLAVVYAKAITTLCNNGFDRMAYILFIATIDMALVSLVCWAASTKR